MNQLQFYKKKDNWIDFVGIDRHNQTIRAVFSIETLSSINEQATINNDDFKEKTEFINKKILAIISLFKRYYKSYKQLTNARELVTKADVSKRFFLADMLYQLRTSIPVILSYSNLEFKKTLFINSIPDLHSSEKINLDNQTLSACFEKIKVSIKYLLALLIALSNLKPGIIYFALNYFVIENKRKKLAVEADIAT